MPSQNARVLGLREQAKVDGRPIERDLARLIEARDVRADDVLEPADDFHPALVRRGKHVGEDVVAPVIGRLFRSDVRVAIVLRMRRRELAAMEVVVVLLLAVVGQGAAARLASTDAAAVRERREEKRVDGGKALQVVEHALGAFVDERDRAGLNADHRWLGARQLDAREHGAGGDGAGGLEELPSIHGHRGSVREGRRRMYASRGARVRT